MFQVTLRPFSLFAGKWDGSDYSSIEWLMTNLGNVPGATDPDGTLHFIDAYNQPGEIHPGQYLTNNDPGPMDPVDFNARYQATDTGTLQMSVSVVTPPTD